MEYDLEKILPHSHPMIMIDNLEEFNEQNNTVTAAVTINENKIMYDKSIDGIDSLAGIEFMAQTIACSSFFKYRKNEPKIGFLLGTRAYNCSIQKFENGKTYTIKAGELYSDRELVSYECFIYNDNEEVARAVINAYQPENADEFLKAGIVND